MMRSRGFCGSRCSRGCSTSSHRRIGCPRANCRPRAPPRTAPIARQAVRESLVLLKNNKHTLPLDPHTSILVAGIGANDIGMQSGGWTVDWQGNHNTNADFPGGTSIQAGIEAAVKAARRESRDAARG